MRTSIPKLQNVTRFGSFVRVIFRERDNFEQVYENVKYGNLKKIW